MFWNTGLITMIYLCAKIKRKIELRHIFGKKYPNNMHFMHNTITTVK